MCDVCVMLPSLLWLMEHFTLAAQRDLEMIFNPAEAHGVQGVFVFPNKSSPHCGLCHFSPQELSMLHRGPALAAIPQDLVAGSFWEPHFVHSLRSPMLWRKISLLFPNSVLTLSSAALGWLMSTAGGIFLSSSQLPGSPTPSCKCNPSVADSCINFLLPAEFLRGTVHFTNPVCISTMTFAIIIISPGWRGLCLFAGLVELDIYLNIKVAFD